jgi:2',3'-cyclic-nucleotide 2'-phosphodiesterase (5'-nucleotidase family)
MLPWLLVALAAPLSDAPAAPRAAEVALVYTEQGCLGESGTNMGLVSPLAEHLEATATASKDGRGSVRTERVVFSPLRLGDVILFPASGLDDNAAVDAFFAADVDVVRSVVVDDLAVLENDFEVLTEWVGVGQAPTAAAADWLAFIAQRQAERGRPVRARRARIVELARGAATLRALELDAAVAFADAGDRARSAWVFQPAVVDVVQHNGGTLRLVEYGKRIGEEGRTVATLAEAARGREHVVRLHPGGFVGGFSAPDERAVCPKVLARAPFDAAGVRTGDLALGPDGLFQFAAEAKLPFVAGNLKTDDGRSFPGFVELERGGRRIAVLGLVGQSELDKLPAPVRRRFVVEPALEVAPRLLRALIDERPRAPDVVVLLTNARDAELRALKRLSGVDVVVADFADADLVARTTEARFSAPQPPGSRRTPSVVVENAGHTVGVVTAAFDDVGVTGFVHEVIPVLQEGPADLEVRALVAPVFTGVVRGQRSLLPDARLLITLSDDVRAAVVGPRVKSYRSYQDVPEGDAHYTDVLWHRIVNHALQDATDADVAFTRSLSRGDNIRGPVPTFSVESWLAPNQSVVVVDAKGDVVGAALAAVAAVAATDSAPLDQEIWVGGADAQKRIVGGRPLDPRRTYRVVATDAALDSPVLSSTLGGLPRKERFKKRGDASGGVDVDAAGAPLALRAVVVERLERAAERGSDEAAARALIAELMVDRTTRVAAELRFRVDELAAQGSAYRNSDNNLPLFAETRETRSTTPNLFTAGLRLRADLTWDDPAYAVELGTRVLWDVVILDVPGVSLPPQEQADDVQLWTELRFNNLRLTLGEGGVGIVPFVRAALDSEVTPTPSPVDPKQTLPHQFLLPQSAGLVANPGGLVREVRVGAVVQEDLAGVGGGDPVRVDAGVVAGLRLDVPLWVFLLQSESDVRYLVPDADDKSTDLALRLTSTLKLILPVNATTNVFLFADAFVVSGKTEVNRDLGGSLIVGGGLGFADLFTLR